MKQLLTLSLLLISIGTFAQKVKLELNLKVDNTYYLNSNSKFTIDQDIPGHKQTIDMVVTGKIAHKVVAIKDSVYNMEVKYERVGVRLSVGTFTMDMSSDDQAGANPLSKLVTGMLNIPFSMSITRSGRVLSVTGMEKLYEQMSVNFPQATAAQKAQFKSQMQQSFGEKAIMTSFQQAFEVFPKTNVGINDTWSSISELESSGMKAHLKTNYKLKEISDDAYVIHGDATVAPEIGSGYKQVNGIEMRFMNIAGTSTTDLKLDKNTCWIIDSKATKNIQGTADIKDSPKMPGGLKFPMTIIGDVTVSGK